jgi:hypothetical protein
MRVRDALGIYLAENGFTVEAYDEPTTTGSFLGIPLKVPNPPAHRRAIMLHDLHHVATGYGTDHAGEAEISAWETRRGLGSTGLYVSALVLSIGLLGLVVAPRRTWRAFRAPPAGRSLFGLDLEYDALLDQSVGELRALLGVPQEGLAKQPRELHALRPAKNG